MRRPAAFRRLEPWATFITEKRAAATFASLRFDARATINVP
jgi:hypothetical protein